MNVVNIKSFDAPPLCEKEALRYAGCKNADSETLALLQECITEVRDKLKYRVCYSVLSFRQEQGVCDIGPFSVRSEKLAANLRGCDSVLLFAATVGIELDRLISKYSRLSPSRALMLQAIGAERVEALCDIFSAEFEKEHGVSLRPRFSAGYGDLPLDVQKDIFACLNCPKNIGVSLSDSLLMSPTKSVTAFAGIERG